MMFSFDQIRAFVVVAEELHFGRAAQRLQMTQPPLSRQIQKLERSVNVVLLDRNNRGVRLTPAGEAFLIEARRLLALAHSAPLSARRVAEGHAGSIGIGFTATAAVGMLGSLLRQLSENLPQVELMLHELVSRAQLQALESREIDLALMRHPPQGKEYDSVLVHRERLYAAVASGEGYVSATRPIRVEELRSADMIMYSRDAQYFDDLVTRILAGVEPRSVQRVTQVHSMIALVAAGRGVAVVPDSARIFHIPGVEFRPIEGWVDKIVELHATWRRDSINPALFRALELVTLAT